MRPCIFCEILAGRSRASVALEDERFLALLDIHPMRPGHTLAIPRRHAMRVDDLDGDAGALFAFAARVGRAVRRGLGCDDVNFVLNDGPAANQTVPHAHIHVIPRRSGDLAPLLGRLLVRPVQPLLGGPPRSELDRVARAIRGAGERDGVSD